MALIGIAVWDTLENGRTTFTRQTLYSLMSTVDFGRHRLIISDNGSCQATQDLYAEYQEMLGSRMTVLANGCNLGTAVAINRAWEHRQVGELCVKMDNDVMIRDPNWLDLMEEVIRRDPSIGIVGLKRKDLEERPDHHVAWFKSSLQMLPHKPGERWLVVESVQHVMGTCQGYSSALLDKIGFLYQMQDEGNLYGYDDALASLRAHIADFRTVFIPHIEIDHIDPGGSGFTDWKLRQADKWFRRYHEIAAEYRSGKRKLYWEDKA